VIRAVLFDLDGLIIDSEPIHFQAFRGFMQNHEVELPESVMPEFIGYHEIENIRWLKEHYDLPQPLEELVLERRGVYAHLLATADLPVLPGFWELSAEAKRRGLKQAVVSSSVRPQVELPLRRLLDGSDPHRYFDAILTGDDVTHTKPAPDIYLLALEQLGVPASEAIAFEDTPAGVTSAATAGIAVYAVPNEYTRELQFPEARAIFSTLTDALPLLDCHAEQPS